MEAKIENATALESAILCLDAATQKLLRGEDVRSHMFQLCMQLSKHCEEQGSSVAARSFKERAEIFKKMPDPKCA
ncbi:hypothetical protein LCGC14_3096080 [marine sediment metagenome]|uniref:Uncharacterized protein n=1 Tax=marine sediment metagenome TaxID=412755 RepID=A0A0F8WXY5_9ZZZZ